MADAQPKRHHFVPLFYLERWSSHDRVEVRRRDGGRFPTNPVNVAVVNGFYDFRDDDGVVSKEVEKFLADQVEGPASSALLAIDNMGLASDPGSGEREALSAFIAYQMTRTPERRSEMMMAEAVRDFLGGRELTEPLMAEYLETCHLGFTPSERETRASWNFIWYQLNHLDPGTPEMTMEIMHATGLRLLPKLAAMHWSIEHNRKQRLITSDQPVLIWKRPSPRDRFEGVGIETADEIRLPLDPAKQLVLTHRPRPKSMRLSPTETAMRNRALAARCHAFVVGSSKQSALLDSLVLRTRGPTVRFDIGNLYEHDAAGLAVVSEIRGTGPSEVTAWQGGFYGAPIRWTARRTQCAAIHANRWEAQALPGTPRPSRSAQ